MSDFIYMRLIRLHQDGDKRLIHLIINKHVRPWGNRGDKEEACALEKKVTSGARCGGVKASDLV